MRITILGMTNRDSSADYTSLGACVYHNDNYYSQRLHWSDEHSSEYKSSYYVRIYGASYVPVVTLKPQVQIVKNESCAEGAVQGTSTCPYKLQCSSC